ncbi:hypothetical protein SAMN02910400_00245 [Lachnospiraceae bacterium C10]|nr:hypothetical protein SAMN02910400_00245 [Lachnospiraceae bacterium C10]SDW33244.1 hypothetical protein SAMN05216391_10580 [Lachnospiraceae bacterium KHCPX20]
MLFQLYGDKALMQLLGWVLVFAGLIVMNEIGRRTKLGGILVFVVLPLALTVYFITVNVAFPKNDTVVYMNGWFHYAKLYAADIGCVGFLMLKYKWGIGAKEWFKPWPFVIVGINILIAVASDIESAVNGIAAGGLAGGWWFSSENVWLYGGWWNIVNAIAGVINIMCMTGWWGIYSSKKGQDMLWPDMTVWFIVAYDVWNFEYTYCNLPTHTWYCGVALLLAPTFANAFWNKGGWIMNRANTLAIWCMFAQVFPLFQITEPFSVLPSLYKGAVENGVTAFDMTKITSAKQLAEAGVTANPTAQGVVAIAALLVNVICICVIMKRAKAAHKNPYTNEIFVGTKDYEEAMARKEA